MLSWLALPGCLRWGRHLRGSGKSRIVSRPAVLLAIAPVSGFLFSIHAVPVPGSCVGDFPPFPGRLCWVLETSDGGEWALEQVTCLRCLKHAPCCWRRRPRRPDQKGSRYLQMRWRSVVWKKAEWSVVGRRLTDAGVRISQEA